MRVLVELADMPCDHWFLTLEITRTHWDYRPQRIRHIQGGTLCRIVNHEPERAVKAHAYSPYRHRVCVQGNRNVLWVIPCKTCMDAMLTKPFFRPACGCCSE
jgi:hypothetical protein